MRKNLYLLTVTILLLTVACKADKTKQNDAQISIGHSPSELSKISIQQHILKDSQNEKPKNLRDFYYPIDRLNDTLVYHYKGDASQINDRYVVISREDLDGKSYLHFHSFFEPRNGYFIQYEFLKEEITETGANIIDYKEMQYDTAGQRIVSDASITKGESMLWELEKEAPLIWEYNINNGILPDLSMSSKRTRVYNGDQADVDFEKLIIRSLVIRDSFENTVKNESQDFEDTNDFFQMSCYALGIGKFKFIQNVGGKSVEYTLDKILTFKEWSKLKKK